MAQLVFVTEVEIGVKLECRVRICTTRVVADLTAMIAILRSIYAIPMVMDHVDHLMKMENVDVPTVQWENQTVIIDKECGLGSIMLEIGYADQINKDVTVKTQAT